MRLTLTLHQALNLVDLMDDKLKRADFDSFRKLGVDFSGYRGAYGIQYSGCTKVHCMISVVKYLTGDAMGPDPDKVAAWLEERIPGWKKEIGYEQKV